MGGYKRWQSKIDQEIEKALENTEKLPGFGKPLNLDQDSGVPDDMKLAYKVMKDNNVAPEWIMMGKELEKAEQKLKQQIRKAVEQHQRDMKMATTPAIRENIEAYWKNQQQKLQTAVDEYNNRVLTYNLKIPKGIGQRGLLNLQRELKLK